VAQYLVKGLQVSAGDFAAACGRNIWTSCGFRVVFLGGVETDCRALEKWRARIALVFWRKKTISLAYKRYRRRYEMG
jgi:hypothetical protein